MVIIKISSNPYLKNVSFFVFQEKTEEWVEVTRENNPNSKLIKDEYVTGFFPFKANEILSILLRDYDAAEEGLTIIFEGTEDEYLEFESICEQPAFASKIELQQSPTYLENARDILPDVTAKFEELRDLIESCITDKSVIKDDLDKFSDASNDIVPICVVGNYSSGKSTFINALIGHELLPNGDKPVTAKVFKISQADSDDRAFIRVKYEGVRYSVRFSASKYALVDGNTDTEFYRAFATNMEQGDGYNFYKTLNRAILFLNECSDKLLDDLIEITVPFNSSALGRTKTPFVIFDTPGSNTASNADHISVLKDAMRNMSNGLPVYVSEYDSLDSLDNKNLYDLITEMGELDCRFTMIVVNKADESDLPRGGFSAQEENEILGQTIPASLYADGIYFVSSVMGLGSKIDGDFVSDHYYDIYDEKLVKYSNPEHRSYKQLFRYNIMPGQFKRAAIERSESCGNHVLANSGLFCIETEIDNFASKYAAYNKCKQAFTFLENVIGITTRDIEKQRALLEIRKNGLTETLDQGKAIIKAKIDKCVSAQQIQFEIAYPTVVKGYSTHMKEGVGEKDIEAFEQTMRITAEEDEALDSVEDAFKAAREAILERSAHNARQLIARESGMTVKTLFDQFNENREQAAQSKEKLRETKKTVSGIVSEKTVQFVREEYKKRIEIIKKQFGEVSIRYCTDCAEELRVLLLKTVSESDVITDEMREVLNEIIQDYEEISFESAEDSLFDTGRFIHKQFLKDEVVIKTRELAKRFDGSMENAIIEIHGIIESSHKASYWGWALQLKEQIIRSLLVLNVRLQAQNDEIRQKEADIAALEAKLDRIIQYSHTINRMMDWKN